MRKRTIVLLACAVLVSAGCATTRCPLRGTWEMVNPTPDTTTTLPPPVKILTDTHFAFGSAGRAGDVFSGGGTYEYRDGIYTEHIQYHSIGFLIGRSLRFDVRIEGDLWHHAGVFDIEGRRFTVDEVWKRVED